MSDTQKDALKEHNLNDVYERIESLTVLINGYDKRKRSFIDKYGSYIVALFVPIFLATANYITMGNTVQQLVKDMATKAEKEAITLKLEHVNERIDEVITRHEMDKDQTFRTLEKLDKKMDRTLEILISMAPSRNERNK